MTINVASLVSENLDIWTTAIERKSGAGRGGGKRINLYGIDRLRALILDLGVRGKLVPRDSNDEPAADLLKRIKKAKAQRVLAGEVRKPRELDHGHDLKTPFSIPDAWQWVRLDEVGAIVGGGTPPAGDASNFVDGGQGVPWLTPADLGGYKERYISHGERDLTEAALKASSATIMPTGAVLFTSRAPIGYVVIAANPISTNQGFKSIVPYIAECSLFIATAMKSFAKAINENAPGTTFKEVSGKMVAALPFPLPPLAEQQRIVAKVDELMALCDSLEAESATAMAAHQALVEALLTTLTTSTEAADLAINWARLEAHFDTLFITDESIEAFEKTIFDLAVRGRLIAQSAEDEPVRMPRFRQVSQSSDWDEKVFRYGKSKFQLPPNWEIAPLAQVSLHIVDCPHTTPQWTEEGELCIRTNQIKPRWLNLSQPNYVSVETYNERIERLEPKEGDIIYIREGGILGVGCRIPKDVRLCLGQRSMLIRCDRVISPQFMEILINSPYLVGLAKHWTTGGAAPRVNMSTVRGYPIPTPPLAEQDRIVTKVDQLMTLCHLMKLGLASSAQTKRHLADAITERAAA